MENTILSHSEIGINELCRKNVRALTLAHRHVGLSPRADFEQPPPFGATTGSGQPLPVTAPRQGGSKIRCCFSPPSAAGTAGMADGNQTFWLLFCVEIDMLGEVT